MEWREINEEFEEDDFEEPEADEIEEFEDEPLENIIENSFVPNHPRFRIERTSPSLSLEIAEPEPVSQRLEENREENIQENRNIINEPQYSSDNYQSSAYEMPEQGGYPETIQPRTSPFFSPSLSMNTFTPDVQQPRQRGLGLRQTNELASNEAPQIDNRKYDTQLGRGGINRRRL